MKLHHLIQQRQTFLRQARLANAAFVYHELGRFADRIARGQLRGLVTLHLADPSANRAWPSLIADEGSQAVIDEHFIDKDMLDLADLLVFAAGGEGQMAFTFRLEDFDRCFRSALRQELEASEVQLAPGPEVPQDQHHE